MTGVLSQRFINIEEEAAVREIRTAKSNIKRGELFASRQVTHDGYQSRNHRVQPQGMHHESAATLSATSP
jgi:hypothetical protein